jgi:hypothetical protein
MRSLPFGMLLASTGAVLAAAMSGCCGTEGYSGGPCGTSASPTEPARSAGPPVVYRLREQYVLESPLPIGRGNDSGVVVADTIRFVSTRFTSPWATLTTITRVESGNQTRLVRTVRPLVKFSRSTSDRDFYLPNHFDGPQTVIFSEPSGATLSLVPNKGAPGSYPSYYSVEYRYRATP